VQDAHAAQARIATFSELLQNARHDTVDFVGGRSRGELEFIGEAAGDLLLSVHDDMLAPTDSVPRTLWCLLSS
jgi:hypothetical protein